MSKVKVVLNRAGVRELLRSGEMMNICKSHAESVARRAGEGFQVNTMTGKNRVNAEVKAETAAAYYRNLKENTLLKALK